MPLQSQVASDSELATNAFLALYSFYRVDRDRKPSQYVNHISRYTPTALARHSELTRVLDGLALAGVSSVTDKAQGSTKWRVLATALLAKTVQGERQLQLIVAENSASKNPGYDVPGFYKDLWGIFRALARQPRFAPDAPDRPPPAIATLHETLQLRFLSFSFPRFRARLRKHIRPFQAAITAVTSALDEKDSRRRRLNSLHGTFSEMVDLCNKIHDARTRIKLPAKGAEASSDYGSLILQVWQKLRAAARLADLKTDKGPETLFGEDCEAACMLDTVKASFKSAEAQSTKPTPMARYLKKVLTYLTVYNDFLYFAHSDEMRTLSDLKFNVDPMVVGQPAVVDPKGGGSFQADLNMEAFSAALGRVNNPESIRQRILDALTSRGDLVIPDCTNPFKFTLNGSIVHCEVAILQYIVNHPEFEMVVNFVGVSKLSCGACAAYFTAFSPIRDVLTRDSHNSFDVPWALPAVEDPGNKIALAFQTALQKRLTDESGRPGSDTAPSVISSTSAPSVTLLELGKVHRDSGSTSFTHRDIAYMASSS